MVQLAHRYERCNRTSLLMPPLECCSWWNRSMARMMRVAAPKTYGPAVGRSTTAT